MTLQEDLYPTPSKAAMTSLISELVKQCRSAVPAGEPLAANKATFSPAILEECKQHRNNLIAQHGAILQPADGVVVPWYEYLPLRRAMLKVSHVQSTLAYVACCCR